MRGCLRQRIACRHCMQQTRVRAVAAPVGRGWAVVENGGEKQIPFGNDKQEKQTQWCR